MMLVAIITVLASFLTASTALHPVPLEWEVVSRRAHDPAAFTQGLAFDREGRLFESTGQWGRSTLREVDPLEGTVLRSRALPDEYFGEGLASVDDELVQLTWKAGLARRYDADTFALVGSHRYDGEGWGLCYDGDRLVMSDGSDTLTFRDAQSFEVLGTVSVTIDGSPLARLNELECDGDSIWANVWMTDSIVRIDPADGRVDGMLDLRGIIEPHPALSASEAVLNGIAYDAATDTFLVTGKDWPELIEIRVGEPGGARP